MAEQHNGLEQVYEEVRAFVEARCGPGSMTRETFNELCRLGASGLERMRTERPELTHPLLERLEELERRVEWLEAELETLKARVRRLEERK